jgi:predicted acyl esterase
MPRPASWPGRWYGSALEAGEFEARTFYLVGDALQPAAGPSVTKPLPDDPRHGAAAGLWCPFGPHDLAGDQRPDDVVSMTFDSAPLPADLPLLGEPELIVDGAPSWQVVAQLCGRGRRRAAALPGRADAGPPQVRVRLNTLGSREAGQRLRLALAASYWPMVWPSAAPRA